MLYGYLKGIVITTDKPTIKTIYKPFKVIDIYIIVAEHNIHRYTELYKGVEIYI